MAGKVALTVSLQVQAADLAAAGDRFLPYAGVHRAAFPRNVAWKSDVDG
jgi:hypothetical protein